MSSVSLLLQILILYKLMGSLNCYRQKKTKKTQSANFLLEEFLRVIGCVDKKTEELRITRRA